MHLLGEKQNATVKTRDLTMKIILVFAIGAASAIDPTMKMNSRDFSYGYSYALSHCSWILSSISAGLFFWHTIDEASDAY